MGGAKAFARVRIVLLGLFLVVGAPPTAFAQATDELTALNAQVVKLHGEGKFAEAIEVGKRALELAERRYGPEHAKVGTPLNNLAALYRAQGRYAEAIPIAERALALREKALGPKHLDVGVSLNNLAGLYQALGRYAEAEPLYKRDLAISEMVMRLGHPRVGTSLNNLAGLYEDQARYVEAEPLYKRSLAISEKVLGPDHPQVGTSQNNLAALYLAQGRYAEAEPLYRRSLAIREKTLGPEHPDVGTSLSSLALLYKAQGRYAEAEPLYKRSLDIRETTLGPEHPQVGASLNNLAALYEIQGRHVEAEPLHKRSLSIRETALGPEHPDVAQSLNNLAVLYKAQGRYAEAEPLYRRSLAIREKTLGPEHLNVGTSLNNLAVLYLAQGRTAEAEPILKRDLAISEKALGPEHPDVGRSLNNLAWLALAQNDLVEAAHHWRRATALLQRRAERGLDGASEGSSKGEAQRNSWLFEGLIKATNRLAAEGGGNAKTRAAEMFETAQWAQGSEAAASLAQMAARSAGGSPEMAALVRERQDLVAEWSAKDKLLIAARSEPSARRNAAAEKALADRLAAIDVSRADIDARFAKDFPDYAAFASPKPSPVTDVQAALRDDEALVLFLDTGKNWEPNLPQETFIWVVTKSDVRWLRSDLGTPALTRAVTALRCGLDAAAWLDKDTPCPDLTGASYTESDQRAGKPLPFDLARAHAIYKGLLGDAADLIKGKHLLIVPSGALTRLPFQTLVTALPAGAPAGAISREVGRLGAELGPLSNEQHNSLPAGTVGGVRVAKPLPGGPAEAAGLRAEDVLLAVDQRGFATVDAAIATVQAAGSGRAVTLSILRGGQPQNLAATLGTLTVAGWKPLLLDAGNASEAAWLIREHAITVLPSVAALASLRRTSKPSAASKPMIGFGNPLLEGDLNDSDERLRARYARTRTGCAATAGERTAALRRVKRSATPTQQAAGMADIAELRGAAPLPETADELCDVARSIGADPDDVHIGRRATESEIKRLSASGDLARYRIVHFATHGTLAGEIRGTREPGLILTPPDTATAADDGYLSGSEIAGLKLDADWVILSACNTAGAAGGGQGGATGGGQGEAAEALSGLARVFFYAGARALLVSHWEVDSDAAVKLITTAIGAIAKDKSLGRAEALRRAMLTLMADTSRPSNWVPGSHPAVWAPFVVVGEGAAAR